MPDEKPKTYGYREEVLEALLKLLGPYDDITRDNMFGFPAFRASGQIFACVYQNGISLKMPKAAAEAIVQSPGISPFIPFGRARMRQWVHIERKKPANYIKDFPLIEASIHYVRTLKPKKSARKSAKSAASSKAAPAKSAKAAAPEKKAKPAPDKASAKTTKSAGGKTVKKSASPKKKAGAKKPAASKTAPKKSKNSKASKTAKKPAAKKKTPAKKSASRASAGKAAKKASPAKRNAPKKKAARSAGKAAVKGRK